MDAGTLIRQRRQELGLSQRKAAAAAGVSESTWQDYEYGGRGTRNPVTARAICRVLRWRHDALERLADGVEPVVLTVAEVIDQVERDTDELMAQMLDGLAELTDQVTKLADAVRALTSRASASEARHAATEDRLAALEQSYRYATD